jgi:chromosomal replication initiator protein
MTSLGNDSRESRLSIKQIAAAVADYYHLSLEDMCGKQRDKHIVMPRQIAMYLMRQETQASLLEIGQMFGGRDHSTVLHACEKIDREVNINPTLRREIVAIREQLQRE